MANTVRILITAKDEISGPLDKIRDKAGQLAKTDIGKGLMMGAGIAAFGMLKNAAVGALDAVVNFGTGSGAAAREEEVSLARLTSALKANVAGWDGNLAAIESVIESRQRLAFSDDEQRAALADLTMRTKDVTKALELERIAMDLARAKGIDLATASMIIGKVYSGNVGVLTRYGIAVTKGATATEALAEIQKAAAGQAEAFGNTAEGAAEGARIELENLQEEIGQDLLPVVRDLSKWARDDGVPALSGVVDVVKNLADGVGYAVETIDDWTGAARFADDATDDVTKGIGKFDRSTVRARGSLDTLGGKLEDTADDLDDVKDEARKTEQKMDDLRGAVVDAAEAFAEATYGPEQLRLELILTRREMADDQTELDKLLAKGKKTGDDWTRITELRLKLSEGKEETVRLLGKLSSLGQISMADLRKELAKLGIVLDSDGDLAARLRDILRNMPSPPNVRSGSTGGHIGGKAAGGFVPAGELSWVGEGGKKELIEAMPGGGVMVTPVESGGMAASMTGSSPRAGASGGGTVNILNLNVTGVSVLTPGAAEALAQHLAPVVTRWQQDRRLLGAR